MASSAPKTKRKLSTDGSELQPNAKRPKQHQVVAEATTVPCKQSAQPFIALTMHDGTRTLLDIHRPHVAQVSSCMDPLQSIALLRCNTGSLTSRPISELLAEIEQDVCATH
jgi:hypothetical protein